MKELEMLRKRVRKVVDRHRDLSPECGDCPYNTTGDCLNRLTTDIQLIIELEMEETEEAEAEMNHD